MVTLLNQNEKSQNFVDFKKSIGLSGVDLVEFLLAEIDKIK